MFAAPAASVAARPQPALGYRPELDSVRGVALVGVLLAHSSAFLPSGRGLLYSGFIGVDVFFVLSGFLITTLLYEEQAARGGIRLRSFYQRRAWRLVPALLFGIALAGLCALLVGSNLSGVPIGEAALYALAFVGNWPKASLGFLAHTWSLGVEAQFYLVWPVIVVACSRFRVPASRLAAFAVTTGLGVAALRAIILHAGGPVELVHGVLRSDAILFGSALALLRIGGRDRLDELLRTRRIAWCATACFVAYALYAEISGHVDRAVYAKDLLVIGNAAAAVLIGVLVTNADRWRAASWRPVVLLGKLSYSVYLVHYPVFRAFARFDAHGWTAAVAAWALSFALAAVSYALIERPALRWKAELSARHRRRLLDRERVGRRGDAGLEVEGSRREEELVGAV